MKTKTRKKTPGKDLSSAIKSYLLLTLGAVILAFNINLFLAPADIAPGGVSGTAIILNELVGWPIGLIMFVLNIPLIALGFRHMGRFQFLFRTLYAVAIYNFGVDLIGLWVHKDGITNDLLLNALYGGIVGGIGTGLVYRGHGTTAGTGVISRVLQLHTGIPISQLYLFIDGGVVLIAALVFGWEKAMYALITLFVWGIAADYILEGPSVIRTVIIITELPEKVSNAVLQQHHLGLTSWTGKGMFSGEERTILFCTVRRPDVNALRSTIIQVDPRAFLVIGQGHQASGGFLQKVPVKPREESKEMAIKE
ncbi:MAG: hypothetical protein A2Z14_17795 [Chloroflexi bacterium RBG_16_48_8]|nr:MAG: hypothetical protein A2Z14_17795 [Chloroflexi bacterium RBG_16_48_8]